MCIPKVNIESNHQTHATFDLNICISVASKELHTAFPNVPVHYISIIDLGK